MQEEEVAVDLEGRDSLPAGFPAGTQERGAAKARPVAQEGACAEGDDEAGAAPGKQASGKEMEGLDGRGGFRWLPPWPSRALA